MTRTSLISQFYTCFFILRHETGKQPANPRALAEDQYANLVRNNSSGIYFARFRHNGKLIWKGLRTDVLSIAAQRLPDTIKELKDEQTLLASYEVKFDGNRAPIPTTCSATHKRFGAACPAYVRRGHPFGCSASRLRATGLGIF